MPWLHKVKSKYHLELYCLCRMPRDNDMRECDVCATLFHPSCIYGNILLHQDKNGRPYLRCINCRPFAPHPMADRPINILQTSYDLYVAYSSHDIRFVNDILLAQLDRRDGEGRYNLMVSDRDWPAGGSVVDTMVETMRESLHACAIISRNFLSDCFRQLEWQIMVHQRAQMSAVILIDPPDSLEMSPYLRTLVASRNYLEWSDDPRKQEEFWRRFKQFLGQPLSERRRHLSETMEVASEEESID